MCRPPNTNTVCRCSRSSAMNSAPSCSSASRPPPSVTSPPTGAYAAARLGLRHHSIVELSKRCEEAGLLTRAQDPADRRRVLLQLTPDGSHMLDDLSADHAAELNQRAP